MEKYPSLTPSEVNSYLFKTYRHFISSKDHLSKQDLLDFLQSGISYVFPQRPGALVRGVPTAHSVFLLKRKISSTEHYVWPSAKGSVRGQAIHPLYPSVPDAVEKDEKLYQLLSLVDAVRVGRKREKEIAISELRKLILGGK